MLIVADSILVQAAIEALSNFLLHQPLTLGEREHSYLLW